MLAHLRTEAYPAYRTPVYPGGLVGGAARLSVEGNDRAIAEGKRRLTGRTD
jgi:hypothetical protein